MWTPCTKQAHDETAKQQRWDIYVRKAEGVMRMDRTRNDDVEGD